MFTILPPPALAHPGTTALQLRNMRGDVDVHHPAPLLERDLREGPHRERGVEAGVVDEDVEPAAALERLVGQPLHVLLGGDVDGEPDAVRELRRGLLGPLRSAITIARPRGEAAGDGVPDPLRAAGDDGDLARRASSDRRERSWDEDPVLLRVDERLDLREERLPALVGLQPGAPLLTLASALVAPQADDGRERADVDGERAEQVAEVLLLDRDALRRRTARTSSGSLPVKTW